MDRNDVDWAGYFPAVVTPFTESGALDTDTLHDSFVRFKLLLFRGRIRTFHEKKLGPEQSHAFTAEVGDLRSIVQAPYICQNFNACAVASDSGFESMREVFVPEAL